MSGDNFQLSADLSHMPAHVRWGCVKRHLEHFNPELNFVFLLKSERNRKLRPDNSRSNKTKFGFIFQINLFTQPLLT